MKKISIVGSIFLVVFITLFGVSCTSDMKSQLGIGDEGEYAKIIDTVGKNLAFQNWTYYDNRDLTADQRDRLEKGLAALKQLRSKLTDEDLISHVDGTIENWSLILKNEDQKLQDQVAQKAQLEEQGQADATKLAEGKLKWKAITTRLRSSLPSDYEIPVETLEKPCPLADNQPFVNLVAYFELGYPGHYKVQYGDGEVRINVFMNFKDVVFRFLDNSKSVELVTMYVDQEAVGSEVSDIVLNPITQLIKAVAE